MVPMVAPPKPPSLLLARLPPALGAGLPYMGGPLPLLLFILTPLPSRAVLFFLQDAGCALLFFPPCLACDSSRVPSGSSGLLQGRVHRVHSWSFRSSRSNQSTVHRIGPLTDARAPAQAKILGNPIQEDQPLQLQPTLHRLTMLRATTSSLAKRAVQRTHVGALAPSANFHYSARREEEAKTSSEVAESEGFMGTGLSHLYAIPVGICAAVPVLEFQWFRPNEEMLLASTFVAFCVIAYTKGGNAIANVFQEEANSLLKLQNEAEDAVIKKMEENVEYMKLTENIVSDYQDALKLTEESYAKLNAAGKIKPQHDLKAQVEKILSMIAVEEAASYEKAKTAMMAEATESVTQQFLTDDDLKAAALSSALSKIAGNSSGSDPVQGAFVKFFQDKAEAAKSVDEAAELAASRATMVAKMNAVAENEGFYFRLGPDGQPKMVA
eukprot:Nitzschia sp. Nitz4//scaffold89_size161592//118121//119870//NITZ4_002392-RA/size161592-processed-gene-0.19-mRNA-1//1//CDS//3329559658//2051//frame0